MQMVHTPHPAGGDTDVDWQALGSVKSLTRQKRSVVAVGGLELLVIFHRRRLTVVENRCPHRGAGLANARVSRRSLTCPMHSHRYSLVDGMIVSPPGCGDGRNRPLTLFPTRVADGCLYAAIDRTQLGA
jgi:3-phenylpropionate/trans-cinnamate dioxygenase ferredoxin subunit